MRSLIERKNLPIIACVTLLAAHASLLVYSAARNSATFDEPAHLAAGVAYWKHHDFPIYDLSPPLLRLWAAIPAVLTHVNSPPTHAAYLDREPILNRHWLYAEAFVAANPFQFRHPVVSGAAGDDSHLLPGGMDDLSMGRPALWTAQRHRRLRDVLPQSQHPRQRSAGDDRYRHHGGDIGVLLALVAVLPLPFLVAVDSCLPRGPRRPSLQVHGGSALAHVAGDGAAVHSVAIAPGNDGSLPAAWIAIGRSPCSILLNAVYGFRETGRPIGRFQVRLRSHATRAAVAPGGFSVARFRGLLVEGFDAQKADTQSGYQGFLFGEVYHGSQMVLLSRRRCYANFPSRCCCCWRRRCASKLGPRGTAPPARRAGERSPFPRLRRLRRRCDGLRRHQHRHAISPARVSPGDYSHLADLVGRSGPQQARDPAAFSISSRCPACPAGGRNPSGFARDFSPSSTSRWEGPPTAGGCSAIPISIGDRA